MKKKYLLIVPAFALALVGGGTAMAYGGGFGRMASMDPTTLAQRWEEQIAQQANLLGISVDEMKTKWAEGKTLADVAKEKGISNDDLAAKLKAARDDEMKQMLQTLVAQGKITQAQADARLKAMQDRIDKADKKLFGGRHNRGFFDR